VMMSRGRIVASGTMSDLQEQTASEQLGLEDLFLKLTGGPREHHLDAVLGR